MRTLGLWQTMVLVLIAYLLFDPKIAGSQVEKITLVESSCNFLEALAIHGKDVWIFLPDKDAEIIVEKILQSIGLPKSFELRAADVPSATAAIKDAKRYILYRQDWIVGIESQSGTQWGKVGIFAHEIGHHLLAHTLIMGGNRQADELAADQYAGRVMKRMGATLDQAKSGFAQTSKNGSDNYPPRSARQAAVAHGWLEEDGYVKRSGPPGVLHSARRIRILDSPNEAYPAWSGTYTVDGKAIGTVDSFFDRVGELNVEIEPGKHSFTYKQTINLPHQQIVRECNGFFDVESDSTFMMRRSPIGPNTIGCDLIKENGKGESVNFENNLVNGPPGFKSIMQIWVNEKLLGALSVHTNQKSDRFNVTLSNGKHNYRMRMVATYPGGPQTESTCQGEFLVTGSMTVKPQPIQSNQGFKCVFRRSQ